MPFELRLGDSRSVLKDLPSDSIDTIVTDPPYELSQHEGAARMFARAFLRPISDGKDIMPDLLRCPDAAVQLEGGEDQILALSRAGIGISPDGFWVGVESGKPAFVTPVESSFIADEENVYTFLETLHVAGVRAVRSNYVRRRLRIQSGRCWTLDIAIKPIKVRTSGFMGKAWDGSKIAFDPALWAELLRVAKPGATALIFGGSRTWHRVAVAVEDAGWEIVDTIMWLYGQGWPKGSDISKAFDKRAGAERPVVGVKPGHEDFVGRTTQGHIQFWAGALTGFDRPWMHDATKREQYHLQTAPVTDEAKLWEGYNTALKPAFEPIIVAQKPIRGTYVENAARFGVAGYWIDGARIFTDWNERSESWKRSDSAKPDAEKIAAPPGVGINCHPQGRWPANVVLSHKDTYQLEGEDICSEDCPVRLLDVQSGVRKSGSWDGIRTQDKFRNVYSPMKQAAESPIVGSQGGASRFFYCTKASKKDRGEGNDHATVKPTELMRYLVRLTRTPKGGVVLDPFMGSGTTGVAALREDRDFIGIDVEESSVKIARRRLEAEAGVESVLKEMDHG